MAPMRHHEMTKLIARLDRYDVVIGDQAQRRHRPNRHDANEFRRQPPPHVVRYRPLRRDHTRMSALVIGPSANGAWRHLISQQRLLRNRG